MAQSLRLVSSGLVLFGVHFHLLGGKVRMLFVGLR